MAVLFLEQHFAYLHTCCFVFILESRLKACLAAGEVFEGPQLLRKSSWKSGSQASSVGLQPP